VINQCKIILLLAAFVSSAQNSDGATSYSLFIRATVYPFTTLDVSGHGKVEAVLRNNKGAPIPGQEIELISTCGNFSCKLPDVEGEPDTVSFDRSCLFTGNNGKILVYLIGIPFNAQGMVTASCIYRDVSLKASCTFWVKRMVIKNKRRLLR
jgi:hypothetical protein